MPTQSGYLAIARQWLGRRAPDPDPRMCGSDNAFAVRQRLTGRRETKSTAYDEKS